jgi:hypothetical protein
MGAPSPFFFQQSGSAQITLTRPSYSDQGTLSVEFSTNSAAPPESSATVRGERTDKFIAAATPGQQYLPVDETVTFQPGQTALTVSVPIVPSAANPGIVLVEMTTTPLVTGGYQKTGEFAILSGPDQLPLSVNNAQIVKEASGASAIALTFNQPMAQPSVENIQNYMITQSPLTSMPFSPRLKSKKPASSHGGALPSPLLAPLGGAIARATLVGGLVGSALGLNPVKTHYPPVLRLPLQSATYDAATNTVTLVTKNPLNPRRVYQVVIDSGLETPGRGKHNAGIGGDLTDQEGNSLNSSNPQTSLLFGQPQGGNLVDLSRSISGYFTASPTLFNVSSRPSGPPLLANYSRPFQISGGFEL